VFRDRRRDRDRDARYAFEPFTASSEPAPGRVGTLVTRLDAREASASGWLIPLSTSGTQY